MIGVVMAGGRSSRMGEEKLLLPYRRPIILHVIGALRESRRIGGIIAVTSPNAPRTARLLAECGVRTVQSAGRGYSSDVGDVVRGMDGDVIVAPGDLPLLDGDMVRRIISGHRPRGAWTSVVVTRGFARSLGLSGGFSVEYRGEECYYTGISVVDASAVGSGAVPQAHAIHDDRRVAFNVNTPEEYSLLRSRMKQR